MNIVIFGAAGFIGTNLLLRLSSNPNYKITAVDLRLEYFKRSLFSERKNIQFLECSFSADTNFISLLEGQDLVFHLASTTIPATSNSQIKEGIISNVEPTVKMLDACVIQKVKKVVFMSSGGAVYGRALKYPIQETCQTDPISSYGIQKLTIEKLLGLYCHLYGLDYVAIRLANPYGPYQRPDGRLGVVTTFIYKAIKRETLLIYGDGNVVRDFIYIDDAVEMICNLAFSACKYHVYNVGSGSGTSINTVIQAIQGSLNVDPAVTFISSRNADVAVNILDISRYLDEFAAPKGTNLEDGIRKTAHFLEAD